MIRSFKSKSLKQLWDSGYSPSLPQDQVKKILQMLVVIDNVELVPQDFEFFKSWKAHPHKGKMKGMWSFKVKENWRIAFEFYKQDAFNIDYVDYH